MPSSRQLAAIMFTYIVGYTALMGEDEKQAFELLRKNRQLQKPLIEKFNGKWIKELGDGVLASFSTVTDAVLCATEIQHACGGINGLKLRIGIHQGEVVFEDDDVFGDGVNIASRLQALAPIGGIWISESAYKNVSNKKEIITQFVKAEQLRNVKEPVQIYEVKIEPANKSEISSGAHSSIGRPGGERKFKRLLPFIAAGLIIILIAGYFVFKSFMASADSTVAKNKIKSIVVLYFNNMTGDPGQEYFCDGITEEITDRLTKIKGLDVKSRHSALAYKDKPINATKIAEELKVDVLIEGSYRKSGNAGKITVQLIDGKTDDHYWSESFVMELADIFKVQSDIAVAIANKLQADISPETMAKIDERGTDNVEAYDNFLKGSFFHYKRFLATRKDEDLETSKKYFEMAIQLDSGYADAYAGLSDLYDSYSNDLLATDKFPNIFEAKEQLARKAFKLNPSSAMVNRVMAWTLLRHKVGDRDSSLFFAKKAFHIDPSDPMNCLALGQILSQFGLNTPAIPITQEAIRADPLDPNGYAQLGNQQAMLGNYADAKQALHKSLQLSNDRFDAESRVLFWLIYFDEFEPVEKRLEARLADKNVSTRAEYKFLIPFLHAKKGEFAKVDSVDRHNPFAVLWVNRNKISKDILDALTDAVQKQDEQDFTNYDFLRNSHFFGAYRNDPDFKKILAKAKQNQKANILTYENFDVSD